MPTTKPRIQTRVSAARTKPAAQPSPLLTTVEAAALLRVHPKHIYRLLKKGLPAQRVGDEWRFVCEDLLAWAADRGARAKEPLIANTPVPSSPAPLVAANGDVLIEVLLEQVAASAAQPVGLVQADCTSSLAHLQAGHVLAAGVHGTAPPRQLAGHRVVQLHLARREVGLAFSRGKKLRALGDLMRLRLASRPITAGIRKYLDEQLRKDGIDPDAVAARAAVHVSHRNVALSVLRGEADVGLCSLGWANQTGLAFLPLAIEPYGLSLHASSLATPVGIALGETAQSQRFRKALIDIAGYDTRDTGSLRFDDASA